MGRCRDTLHPNLLPGQLAHYFFDHCQHQTVRSALKLINANNPSSLTAGSVDKLKRKRNIQMHPQTLQELDDDVSDAIKDLNDNPRVLQALNQEFPECFNILMA